MEGKWPNITHRWSVILTDSKGRKSNPTFTEITSAFEGLRPCAPLGTCSTSSADTECVPWAVLTQSVLLVWNAALALPHPPSPVPALSPRPGKAAPRCCPENTSGETKPMCRFLKYWLRYLLLPPKVYVATVLLLVFPAPSSHPRVFHCSSSALRPASFGGAGTRGVAVGI